MAAIPAKFKRTAINWDEGVQNCGGDEEIFRMMLDKFEEMSFNQTMNDAFNAVMEMDFDKIWEAAYILNGPYGFIAIFNFTTYTI